MKLLLDAIQFCKDPLSTNQDALKLRWDATRDVTLPEWRRGVCLGPEDCPVAYAISEMENQVLTIQARFRQSVPSFDQLEIRAINASHVDFELFLKTPRNKGTDFPRTDNPLGEVLPQHVMFGSNGLSELEIFEITGSCFDDLGVGVWNTTWQWQYRCKGGDWIDFDQSEHRVFLLLETPKEPWTTQVPLPLGLSFPRVDALEYACRWARGSRTRTEVSAGITSGLYHIGANILRYDRPNGGGSHYLANLSRLLERLRGGEGNGGYVNCEDCAYVVTTMANLMGCELWSCPVFDQDWETNPNSTIAINPMIVIGDSEWGFPFPDLGEVFKFHQVAFDGEATLENVVFDACLAVDGDDEPNKLSPGRTPLLPAGLPFIMVDGLGYRERFASPAGQGCRPDENWRIRWAVDPVPAVPRVSPVIREFANWNHWRGSRAAGDDILFFPFAMTGTEIPGWYVIHADRFIHGPVPFTQFIMGSELAGSESRLQIEAWQHPSRVQAHEHLADLLGRLEGGALPRIESPKLGDIAFANSSRLFMTFARGNLVVRLRNVGFQHVSVQEVAQVLDQWLTERPISLPESVSVSSNVLASGVSPKNPVGYKYFAEQGELRILNEAPILEGASDEATVVRVALHSPGSQFAEILKLGSPSQMQPE